LRLAPWATSISVVLLVVLRRAVAMLSTAFRIGISRCPQVYCQLAQ
jgi:hypothetical protein